MRKAYMKYIAHVLLLCLLLSGCGQTEGTVISSEISEVFVEQDMLYSIQTENPVEENTPPLNENNEKLDMVEQEAAEEEIVVSLEASESGTETTTDKPQATPEPTVAPSPTEMPAPTVTPAPEATPQPTTELEYPKVDAEPLAKNISVLEDSLWRERLLGNQSFSVPIKDFYFESKDVTPSQMKEELDSLKGQVPGVVDMVCETSQTGELDLAGSVIVYLQEEILFGSREAFDAKYASALENHVPKTVEILLQDATVPDLQSQIATMSDEEYVKMQQAIYNLFYECALKCTTQTAVGDEEDYPIIKYEYKLTITEAAQYFIDCEVLYDYIESLQSVRNGKKKTQLMIELTEVFKKHAPIMCFEIGSCSAINLGYWYIQLKACGVYETIQEPNGTITLDKTKYKSLATMAKEADDKLNQIVDQVIDSDMSMWAKEYALFHFCDTYFMYDYDNGKAGDKYACTDSPYTIALPIMEDTGKKNPTCSSNSTQDSLAFYTTVMTGWGVCVGHADVFQALCNKVGIRCTQMSGNQHRWNLVNIYGDTYLVDAGKRAPFPHFNISYEWKDTYETLDENIYNCVKEKEWFKKSEYSTYLYQAGYVYESTQQDGEWIYYINFDDNGSLYKVNVDGTRNAKVCDSGTTIPEGYAWVTSKYGESEVWATQWANAQYGLEYSGEGYTNSGAMDYRWALGFNFDLKKENGNIIYTVDNISKTVVIPMNSKKEEVVSLTWNNNDAYVDLGIVSGTAVVDVNKSPEDSVDKILAVVDGWEYPVKDIIVHEMGTKVDFTFRLPTDEGMNHHELQLVVLTKNGGVKRVTVSSQTLHPTGIKESYLWNGKYHVIEGITAKNGMLAVFVKRYTEDGQLDASATLSLQGYKGKEAMNVPFVTYKESNDTFLIWVGGENWYRVQFAQDEKILIELKPDYSDIGYLENDNVVYLFSAEGFCMLADKMSNGEYLNATIEVCADLDFASLPKDVAFKAIGSKSKRFAGKWHGNNYRMKGLTPEITGDSGIFDFVEDAVLQDIYVCDSHFAGTETAGIVLFARDTVIENLWVENVSIHAEDESENTGVIASGENCVIKEAYLNDVTVHGDYYVGGLAGKIDGTLDGIQIRGNSQIYGEAGVGGIIGCVSDSYDRTSITNCLSEAEASATSGNTGGIAGSVRHISNLAYCMNYGKVSTSESGAGGIVGFGYKITNFYHLENYGMIQGEEYVGGIAGIIESTPIDTVINGGSVIGKNGVGGIFGQANGNEAVCFAGNKGEVKGENGVGLIGGGLSKDIWLFYTMCTPEDLQLTSENVTRMFGRAVYETHILQYKETMPLEAGRGTYK